MIQTSVRPLKQFNAIIEAVGVRANVEYRILQRNSKKDHSIIHSNFMIDNHHSSLSLRPGELKGT